MLFLPGINVTIVSYVRIISKISVTTLSDIVNL